MSTVKFVAEAEAGGRPVQRFHQAARGLAGQHADFRPVIGEALNFAPASLKIEPPGQRERLLQHYLRIDAYPEVPQVLRRLRAARPPLFQ